MFNLQIYKDFGINTGKLRRNVRLYQDKSNYEGYKKKIHRERWILMLLMEFNQPQAIPLQKQV